jgi:hypothetical protein
VIIASPARRVDRHIGTVRRPVELAWMGQVEVDGTIRPGKAIAKALRAGFQRIAQRARPLPVGSSEQVTK